MNFFAAGSLRPVVHAASVRFFAGNALAIAVVVVAVVFPVRPSFAASAGMTATQRARIESIFSDLHKGTPGCVAGVVRDGKVAYVQGFGMADLGQRVRMSTDTVLEIGSLSKQFTAASVLLLVREGKLSLSDPVTKYLSGFPAYARTVTIGDLMYHTGGIRDIINLQLMSGMPSIDGVSQRDGLAMIKRQQHLNFPSGTEYEYDNSGYLLLAEIVHRVSHQHFAEFMDDRIFKPLGMLHSYITTNVREIVNNKARSYRKRKKGGYRLADSNWAQWGMALT